MIVAVNEATVIVARRWVFTVEQKQMYPSPPRPHRLRHAKVVENRKQRERVSHAAKTALVALEKGASARAIAAAAQDTASRWRRDKGLEQVEEACKGG